MANTILKKVHVNYLAVTPISEILFKPNLLNSHFAFLADKQDYANVYKKAFVAAHKQGNKNKNMQSTRLPFVRKLGQLKPLAGHEIKNSPLYKTGFKNGGIHGLLDPNDSILYFLPLKLIPNWKITTNKDAATKCGLTKFRCKLLTKIYPLGMVSYQMRLSFLFENGIDIEQFIHLLSNLKTTGIMHRHGESVDPNSVIKTMHDTLLLDLAKNTDLIKNKSVQEIHRIIMIEDAVGPIDRQTNRKELAALISLQNESSTLTDTFVSSRIDASFEGMRIGQFIIFHPQATILNPVGILVKNPEYKSYVMKCMRSNFTSIVEIATIAKNFSTAIQSILEKLISNPDLFGVEESTLATTVENLLQSKLFDEHLLNFTGGHNMLYDIIDKKIGISESTKSCVYNLGDLKEKLEKKMFTIPEQIEAGKIIADLDDIYKISKEIADKDPFQVAEQQTLASALSASASDTRNKLMAYMRKYNEMKNEPFAQQGEMLKLHTSIYSLILDTYRTDILPQFQQLTQKVLDNAEQIKKIANEKRTAKAAIESPDEVENNIRAAKDEIQSALQLKPSSEPISTISNFVVKVRPYAEKIIKAAKIALSIIAIFI